MFVSRDDRVLLMNLQKRMYVWVGQVFSCVYVVRRDKMQQSFPSHVVLCPRGGRRVVLSHSPVTRQP